MQDLKQPQRLYGDVGGTVVKCSGCIHRYGTQISCEAFPDGIPIAEIMDKEGECNNGFQYETKR